MFDEDGDVYYEEEFQETAYDTSDAENLEIEESEVPEKEGLDGEEIEA